MDLNQGNDIVIEVFCTNVNDRTLAESLVSSLLRNFDITTATFDLDDCDRVLRTEGRTYDINQIPSFLNQFGVHCKIMPDE